MRCFARARAVRWDLQDRAKTNQSGELTALHKINHPPDLWEKRFESQIADPKRSPYIPGPKAPASSEPRRRQDLQAEIRLPGLGV
ncbi:hypothetical protein GCM10010530_41090 [Kribbella aluminosa]